MSVERMSAIPDPAGPRLLLVDGHAYAYRAFFAIRSLQSPDGAPTNAIYGFIKMLEKMRAILKPTHVLVAWDAGLAAERVAQLPGYKANRPSTPEPLEIQFPQIQQWLVDKGYASWSVEGTEADDWLATYAVRATKRGWETVLASADKDFMQLVQPGIFLFNPGDKLERLWGPTEVEAKTGVLPHQVVDWLSLVGDAADNIPGAPGIGPKTAAELLKRFGSVDGIYSRLAEIKSENQRNNLQQAEAAVRRNQAMIRLWTHLEGGLDLDGLQPGRSKTEALRESYRRWGFKSMLAELLPADGGQTTLW
jgi:DNA polymerase-1